MSEREFDKFLDILQRWHKDDYYTTADALGDARALFEAEHAKVSEPKLDTRAERAELQVSLLNEIGLTLTAVARALAEQAETLKTYKLSLEGIQGLLVALEHSFDVIAEVQANSYDAVVTKFMHIEKRLAQIEERLRVEMEGMRNIVDALGERLDLILGVLGKRDSQVGRKPRKAGKRKRVKR